MTILETLLLVVHLLVAVAVCGFVLLQHGKGADMGAAFGSGSSGSLFGAAGSANFLSRTTAVLATVFFLSSLGLTWFATTRSASRGAVPQGVMDTLPAPASKASDVPATPGGAPATSAEPAKAATPAAPATPVAPAAPASAPAGSPAESKAADVPK
jgi:preprotein translocase subunit SecG